MKIGINILLWALKLKEENRPLLDKIKRAGYDGVEIPVFEPDVEYCKTAARYAREAGLELTAITSVTPEANPCHSDSAVRQKSLDHLKGVLDSVAELGASILGGPFHSCFKEFTGVPPTMDEIQWSSEVLRKATEYGEQYRIELAPEALNRFECYLINTAKQACDLAKVVDHPNFGYHHDTFHANIEEKSTPSAILSSGKYIKHVHISENDRGTPGKGQIKFSEIFQALKEIKYDNWLTIEAFAPGVKDFSNHINVWREYSPEDEILNQGLSFIRKFWYAEHDFESQVPRVKML